MNYYETAQICKNGHVIDAVNELSDLAKSFCPKCGQGIIIKCEQCDSPIQGRIHIDSVISSRRLERSPAYCYNCGKPFPWTVSNLASINELLDLDDKLSDKEKDVIRDCVPDLLAETPKTQVAVVKSKILMKKMGDDTFNAVKVSISGFASETVKKALFN